MKILQINASDKSTGGASRIAFDLHSKLNAGNATSVFFAGEQVSQEPGFRKIKKSTFESIVSHLLANDFHYFKTNYLLSSPDFLSVHVVHAHNLHGWYFNLDTLRKMSEQKPVVWTLHDMWAITPHCAYAYESTCVDGFFPCLSRTVYPSIWWPNEKQLIAQKRDIYAHTNMHLVTPSEWLATKVRQSVLNDKPLTVIPNGIDTTVFTPQDQTAARSTLGLPLDKKIVLFIANQGLTNQFKGGALVREVAARFTDQSHTVFLCVGGTTSESSGNLLLRPGVSDKAILAQYYSAADVLLFPSLAENFPLVILEALACGLPVVTHDVGGVTEAITHLETGHVSAYCDTAGLQHGLHYFLEMNEEKRSTVTKACRDQAVSKYSLETMVNAYVSLYTALV